MEDDLTLYEQNEEQPMHFVPYIFPIKYKIAVKALFRVLLIIALKKKRQVFQSSYLLDNTLIFLKIQKLLSHTINQKKIIPV